MLDSKYTSRQRYCTRRFVRLNPTLSIIAITGVLVSISPPGLGIALATDESKKTPPTTSKSSPTQAQEGSPRLVELIGEAAPPLPDAGWIGDLRPATDGYLLVYVWASWVGPDRRGIEMLNQLHRNQTSSQEAVNEKLSVVGVHYPFATVEEVENAVSRLKLQFPVVLPQPNRKEPNRKEPDRDEAKRSSTVAGYPIEVLPISILIDAKGRIAALGSLESVASKWRALTSHQSK